MAGDRGLLLLVLSVAAVAGVASAAGPFLSGEFVLVGVPCCQFRLFPFVIPVSWLVRRQRVSGDRRIHGEELVAGQDGCVSFSFLLNFTL